MRSAGYGFPFGLVIVYMLFCYFGVKFMEKRKPFDLRLPLAAWNLFLALFSFYGVTRMVPNTLFLMSRLTFEETLCAPAYLYLGAGVAGLSAQLFTLSKIPELIDTVFIVLRKKPLIFLHWYHHVTVLVFCWNMYVTESMSGHYYMTMNYSVHAIMYFYYYLQAIKAIPKWFPSWIITLAQIAQMFIGTALVMATTYYHFYGGKLYPPGTCNNHISNIIAGGIIYSSYLYLFVEFAIKRFVYGVTEEGGKSHSKPLKKTE